jgi:phage-related tail fiber protein
MFDLKIRNNVIPTQLTFENAPATSNTVTNKGYVDSVVATSVSAKTITLTGDVIGVGSSTVASSLSTTGITPGVYSSLTIDSKGRATAGSNLTLTGDVSGTSSNGSLNVSLANTGVVAGSYVKVTVDAKGRVISGQSTLTAQDVVNSLGYTPINKAGDTMGGNLRLNADPSHPLDAASKQYIDSKIWLALAVGY